MHYINHNLIMIIIKLQNKQDKPEYLPGLMWEKLHKDNTNLVIAKMLTKLSKSNNQTRVNFRLCSRDPFFKSKIVSPHESGGTLDPGSSQTNDPFLAATSNTNMCPSLYTLRSIVRSAI